MDSLTIKEMNKAPKNLLENMPSSLWDYLHTDRMCSCHNAKITHYWTMGANDLFPTPSCPITHEKCFTKIV